MRIDVGAVLTLAGQALVVLTGLASVYIGLRRGLRGWIAGIAADTRHAADQLRTTNGTSVAQYVERMAGDLAALQSAAVSNHDLATSALSLARVTSDRLDAHLTGHDKP